MWEQNLTQICVLEQNKIFSHEKIDRGWSHRLKEKILYYFGHWAWMIIFEPRIFKCGTTLYIEQSIFFCFKRRDKKELKFKMTIVTLLGTHGKRISLTIWKPNHLIHKTGDKVNPSWEIIPWNDLSNTTKCGNDTKQILQQKVLIQHD